MAGQDDRCKVCGAVLVGPFCATCGARAGWAPPDPATVTARPLPPAKVPFMRRSSGYIFTRTFLVLMLVDAVWAIYSISESSSELEADGNEFAGLVWIALPIRMMVDAIPIAVVGGAAVIVGHLVKARRPR